jgi:hypothetical protein
MAPASICCPLELETDWKPSMTEGPLQSISAVFFPYLGHGLR